MSLITVILQRKYKLELQWSNLKQLVGKYYRVTEFQLSSNIYMRMFSCPLLFNSLKCVSWYFSLGNTHINSLWELYADFLRMRFNERGIRADWACSVQHNSETEDRYPYSSFQGHLPFSLDQNKRIWATAVSRERHMRSANQKCLGV